MLPAEQVPATSWQAELLIQLTYALAQVRILFDELRQRLLDEVEECVDLVLVVATLADRRLAERNVVHVSWSQLRHGRIPSRVIWRSSKHSVATQST